MSVCLASDMAYQYLPSGDCVVYSPRGSARPFVLGGMALDVFRQIQHEEQLDLTVANTVTILDYFAQEKLIVGHVATSAGLKPPPPKQKRKTFSFWIHSTDRCNLRCSYCYVIKGRRKLTHAVSTALIDTIVRDADTLAVKEIHFKFAGGEPTLALPQIIFLLDQAKARLSPLGLRVSASIITNGILITPKLVAAIKKYSLSVMVSLDGIGEYNDARHYADGRSSYDDVVVGIDRLIESGIKPTVLTVLSNINVLGFEVLVDFVLSRDLGISLSLSRECTPEDGLAIDMDLFSRVFVPKLYELSRRDPEKLPRVSFNGIVFEGRRSRICGAGGNYLAMGPTGSLSSCQMTISNPLHPSVAGCSLRGVCAKHTPTTIPNACGDCVWRHVCCGGCQVLAEKAGTLGQPSVVCPLMKEIIPIALALEGRKIQSMSASASRKEE